MARRLLWPQGGLYRYNQAASKFFSYVLTSTTIRAHLKEITRPMKLTARIPVTAALLALLLGTVTGWNRLKARDQLNKGIHAFKNARYEEAANQFHTLIQVDPDHTPAH